MKPSLAEAVYRQPYPDYQTWWQLGSRFMNAMADAIVPEWAVLNSSGDPASVVSAVDEYTRLVYGRGSRPGLVDDFLDRRGLDDFFSGEFDALSYAFYRDAFAHLSPHADAADSSLEQARRDFTRRVGRRFFRQMSAAVNLSLPDALVSEDDFARLQTAINQVGSFLLEEGYLRDHFAFRFDVSARRGQETITQPVADFLPALGDGVAYALYEMGYPIILPSAVYLYQTIGEAQHHSSRTIEELFSRCGCRASETDDFDPTGFPSEMVVELWEIRVSEQ